MTKRMSLKSESDVGSETRNAEGSARRRPRLFWMKKI